MDSEGHGAYDSSSGVESERFSRKVFVGGLPPDIDEGMYCVLYFTLARVNRLFVLVFCAVFSVPAGLLYPPFAHCFIFLRPVSSFFLSFFLPLFHPEEITASFRRFGSLVVDWPHKAESKSYFPPKGYAFLLFTDESSVQALIDACINEEDKLYLCVSSPTIKDKPVQIRPWRLSDADFVLDASMPLDPRKTVFVGGVPRPLKAGEYYIT